jgi:hypothetical protein
LRADTVPEAEAPARPADDGEGAVSDRSAKLLDIAGVFFGADEVEPRLARTLNMNDTFGWALAFGEEVPDDALDEVARLYEEYGACGLYYWVSERNDGMRSEFHDVQRRIDFVRHEEEFRKKTPGSTKQAYTKLVYTLGKQP